MEQIRKVRFKPTWMIAGAITGGLIAADLRYGIAFLILTSTLWFSYIYGYHRGETEMHDRIFPMIRKEILIPLKNIIAKLREEK